MLLDTKSLFSLRSWLFYAEVLVVVGFVVLASLYIRRGSADPESPTRSTVGDLIERADNHFARQDFVNALLFYWRALLALEKAGEQQVVSVKGAPQSITRVRLHTNLRIAEIYSQTNWPKDAKARLEHAARIQPDHVDVRLLRGKLLRDEGLDDDLLVQATEEFLAVIEKNPHNAEAHYLLGILYQGNQQLEEAVEHYKKAIENDPELRSIASEKAPIGILARLQLSRTYSKMLQKYRFLDREYTNEDLAEVSRLESEAILLLEQALEKHPGIDEIVGDLLRLLHARASAHERTGEYMKALQVHEHIAALDPQDVQAWERMADIYAGFLGDKTMALEMYRKLYEIEPHPTILANIKSLEEDIEAEKKALENETENE